MAEGRLVRAQSLNLSIKRTRSSSLRFRCVELANARFFRSGIVHSDYDQSESAPALPAVHEFPREKARPVAAHVKRGLPSATTYLLAKIVLVGSAFLCFTASAGPVKFSSVAEVAVPDSFTFEMEEAGKTIVIRSPSAGLFELRLTFNSLLPHSAARPSLPEEFIVDTAKKRGRDVNRVRGSLVVGFVEPGAPSEVEGQIRRNMHGMFAVGRGYTTMTLSFPVERSGDPELRAFIGGGMEEILATLRYVGS